MNLFENLQMMNKTVVTENDKSTVLNSIKSTKEFVSNNLKLINDQAFASVLREIIFQSNIEWKDVQSIISRHMPEVKIEDLQRVNENNTLTVKIQRGNNSTTDGEGYYNIFPERDKSNLTKTIWDDLSASKIDVTHFPTKNEAKEYITDFAEKHDIELNIKYV